MSKGKFPDFIVAGFQKCGTTSFEYNLVQHPKISMAHGPNNGEFNFFINPEYVGSSTWNKGVDWYKSHFKNDGNLWGETSPNTLMGEGNLQHKRLSKLIPNVKLIFSVRNPADRAFSAYNHYMQELPTSASWGHWNPDKSFYHNVLDVECDWLPIGKYFGEVNKFPLTGFSKEQILGVVQEQMRDNPKVVFDKIFDFLGVPSVEIVNNKIHVRQGKTDEIFKHLPQQRKMSDAARKYLNKYYEKSNQRLFDFLGYEIEEWKT